MFHHARQSILKTGRKTTARSCSRDKVLLVFSSSATVVGVSYWYSQNSGSTSRHISRLEGPNSNNESSSPPRNAPKTPFDELKKKLNATKSAQEWLGSLYESSPLIGNSSSSSVFGNLTSQLLALMISPKSDGAQNNTVVSDLCESLAVNSSANRHKKNEGLLSSEIDTESELDQLFSYLTSLQSLLCRYYSDSAIQWLHLTLPALNYFLEHEEERKTPSQAVRRHRFCRHMVKDDLEYLNDGLRLAQLAYAEKESDIRKGLRLEDQDCQLVYCETVSRPGQPAHFVAVRDSSDDGVLEVLIGVRGTNSFADALTDVLCESVPYGEGQAHEYILKAGQHLYEKHKRRLQKLLKDHGNKKPLRLYLVGHSLGAGAAAIAGMEFQKQPYADVKVLSFGCPALLSKDLAVSTKDYILTVVNDRDVIPRTSAVTVANLLRDVTEFQWIPYCKRDLCEALHQLKFFYPEIFTDRLINQIRLRVEPMMDQLIWQPNTPQNNQRLEPVLFPPGKVLHLYRNGYGIAGAYVPNDFFSEIDVSRRMIFGE